MQSTLFNLLHLSDPTLPIGAFSHSGGLETYTQKEIITTEAELKTFLIQLLTQNILHNDAAYISLVYNACKYKDWKEISTLDALCHASKHPKEIREASKKLGARLHKIFSALVNGNLIEQLKTLLKNGGIEGHYCILYAIYAYELQIPKKAALEGFFYNITIGYITNAVKLIPLSQNLGQVVLFELLPLLETLTQSALKPNLDLLGTSTTAFDIKAMEHEHLYSRLYMS